MTEIITGQSLLGPPCPAAPAVTLDGATVWEPDVMQVSMLSDPDCRNVLCAVPILGRCDKATIESSLKALQARHSLLRSHYARAVDGSLVLVTPVYCDGVTDVVRLRETPVSGQASAVVSITDALTWMPFDPYVGPLFRCTAICLSDTLTLLMVAVHHSVADAFCIGIIRRDLLALLRLGSQSQTPALPPLPVEYREFVRARREWLRSPDSAVHCQYWREVLFDSRMLFRLPYDRKKGSTVDSQRPDMTGGVSDQTVAQLRAIAAAASTTLATVFYTVLIVVLSAWSGSRDVASWICHLGRTRRELLEVVGCFIDYWPLRIQTDEVGSPGTELEFAL